ncbi:MAG: CBS domain-containing protein [Deltaproteobacteria bacterium]|nr:CBS domain-containing protein [Deltaproteobacteria bacterium]
MSRDVLAVAPDTSLATAARLFATRRISGAPVIDPDGRPRGVVTQTDLVDPDRDRTDREGISLYYRVTPDGAEPQGDRTVSEDGVVADVMSPYVFAIGAEAPLVEAIRTMVTESVHRLLVEEGGKLVGIVTSMDVLRALSTWSRTGDGRSLVEALSG